MAQQEAKRNPYLVNYTVYEGGRATVARITPAERERRRRARLMRRRLICGGVLIAGVLVISILAVGLVRLIAHISRAAADSGAAGGKVSGVKSIDPEQGIQGIPREIYLEHPTWTEDFLTPNEYSRPGESLKQVKNIFVHYTANQGTSAAQNRSYFEQLKDTHERSASAHFIIGYEGEIIQCIPLDEQAYAVKTRNNDSVSIECCYLADDGSFTQETYDSLLTLLGWLMKAYDLEEDDILRHYDCGGKKCPAYYVKYEDAWERLKKEAGEL